MMEKMVHMMFIGEEVKACSEGDAYYQEQKLWASLEAQVVKKSCLKLRRPGFDPWVRKIPWSRVHEVTKSRK